MKKILKSGFTLLELLIVIVILGLLVSLVSINVLPTLSKAYSETARVDISRIEQALVMYKINEGNYPSEDEGISKLVEGGYCLLYTSPSPRDRSSSRMPSSA